MDAAKSTNKLVETSVNISYVDSHGRRDVWLWLTYQSWLDLRVCPSYHTDLWPPEVVNFGLSPLTAARVAEGLCFRLWFRLICPAVDGQTKIGSMLGVSACIRKWRMGFSLLSSLISDVSSWDVDSRSRLISHGHWRLLEGGFEYFDLLSLLPDFMRIINRSKGSIVALVVLLPRMHQFHCLAWQISLHPSYHLSDIRETSQTSGILKAGWWHTKMLNYVIDVWYKQTTTRRV